MFESALMVGICGPPWKQSADFERLMTNLKDRKDLLISIFFPLRLNGITVP